MLPPLSADMTLARQDLFLPEAEDSFVDVPGLGLQVRDLGLGALSGGAMAGQVFRASPDGMPRPGHWHMHELVYQIGYITRGWALYEFEGVGTQRFERGTGIYHLPRNRLRVLDCSADFEGVWIKSPARDRITVFVPAADGASCTTMVFDVELK